MEHLKREAAEPELVLVLVLVPPRAKGGRLVVHAAQVQAPRRSGPGERAPCAAHMYKRQGLHVPREGGWWVLVRTGSADPLAWLRLGLEGRGQKMETKANLEGKRRKLRPCR